MNFLSLIALLMLCTLKAPRCIGLWSNFIVGWKWRKILYSTYPDGCLVSNWRLKGICLLDIFSLIESRKEMGAISQWILYLSFFTLWVSATIYGWLWIVSPSSYISLYSLDIFSSKVGWVVYEQNSKSTWNSRTYHIEQRHKVHFEVLKKLLEALDIQLHFSITSHPQTNRWSERMI